jgi:hypothetical protein
MNALNTQDISCTINEMIKDKNVLSAFELNEKNLQFLKELRKVFALLNTQRMTGILRRIEKSNQLSSWSILS